MKKATRRIIEIFPQVESRLKEIEVEGKPKIEINAHEIDELINTFTHLATFFEEPEKEPFNIQEIYENLNDDWLRLALETINIFFEEDTYLMNDSKPMIIKDEKDYLNQKEFANFLNENGQTYSEAKMSVYVKRGTVPEPDLTISNQRYWKKEVCENYLFYLQNKNKVHKKMTSDLVSKVLNDKQKNLLVLGNAGSGKTEMLHDILANEYCPTIYFGLNKTREDVYFKMRDKYRQIDLRTDSLIDFRLDKPKFDFVFMKIDGTASEDVNSLQNVNIDSLNLLLTAFDNLKKSDSKNTRWRIIVDGLCDDTLHKMFLNLQRHLNLNLIFAVQSISNYNSALLPYINTVISMKNTDRRNIDFIKEYAEVNSSVGIDPSVLKVGEFLVL